jgi:2-oxo-4-hydroxy-4-carboxy-5-ureidoimidazoline decarboxylase
MTAMQDHAQRRLADVGRWSLDEFAGLLGDVFENSPWVARKAWQRRPFADLDELHLHMMAAVHAAEVPQQRALLCAHPELAGREAQTGTLTAASEVEQAAAGLKSLRADERERINTLNAAYRAKHGFPFIVCARHYTPAGIAFELSRRTALDTEREMAEALSQVAAIARLRLGALFPLD